MKKREHVRLFIDEVILQLQANGNHSSSTPFSFATQANSFIRNALYNDLSSEARARRCHGKMKIITKIILAFHLVKGQE